MPKQGEALFVVSGAEKNGMFMPYIGWSAFAAELNRDQHLSIVGDLAAAIASGLPQQARGLIASDYAAAAKLLEEAAELTRKRGGILRG
jgi:hypothetical protein